MIRGVLFDLGGTLYDYGGYTDVDLFRMGAERSYRLLSVTGAIGTDYPTYYRIISRAFLRRWYWSLLSGREISARRLFRRLARPLGIHATEGLWHVLERAWHDPASENVRLLEGCEDLLGTLRGRGVRLGVTSNTVWSAEIVLEMIGRIGIRSYFDAFTFSAELGYRKPHRWIYLDALRKLGVPRPAVAFVGNQVREDVRGPGRLGLRAIHLSREPARRPLFAARTRARDLGEVKAILLGWCSS